MKTIAWLVTIAISIFVTYQVTYRIDQSVMMSLYIQYEMGDHEFHGKAKAYIEAGQAEKALAAVTKWQGEKSESIKSMSQFLQSGMLSSRYKDLIDKASKVVTLEKAKGSE